MNPRFAQLRHHILVIYLWLVLAIGLTSTISLITVIGRPFPGFTMFYHGMSGAWWVDLNPSWWSGMVSGEFEDAQQVIQIEGSPGDQYNLKVEKIYEQAEKEDGYVDLITDSWGKPIIHRVPLITYTWQHFFDSKTYDLLSGLSLWLLSLAMYRVYRDDEVIFVFILATLSLALARWNAIPVDFFTPAIIPQTLDIIYLLFGGSLVGALVAHLSLLFPSRVRFYRPWLITSLYFVAAGTSLIYIVARVLLYNEQVNELEKLFDFIGFYSIYYYGLFGMLCLLVRLGYESWWGQTKRIKIMSRVVLVGFCVGLLYLIPFILDRTGFISYDPLKSWLDMRYLYLLFPATAGLIILRYRAFQEVNFLFMLVPTLALSGLFASMATRLWQRVLGEDVFPPAYGSTTFMVIFVFIFGTAVLFLFQSTWRGYLGRLLQWDSYHLTGLRQLGHSLVQHSSPELMVQAITRSLVQEMALTHTAVWLPDDNEKQYTLRATAGEPVPLPHHINLQNEEVEALKNGRPRHLRDLATAAWANAFTQLNPNEILLPIGFNQQLLGIIYLGARWDEDIFDSRDLVVIELLGQQLAQFLLTANHMAELQAIPRTIAIAQEEERFRLAQELHDTTQQLLGRLPLFLETSRAYIQTDQAEAERLLRLCIQDVAREARNVRAIRNSLAPTRLASGLNQPLQALVDRYHLRFGLNIVLTSIPELDDLTTEGTRHAIYRVVQQALDNIVEHAQASQVLIEFGEENGRIHFQIKDNGQGFNPAQNNTGFGLHSMKARVEMFGGQLTIISHNPHGTVIEGWLPAATAV